MTCFTESVVEDATLDWLADLGHTILHGLDIRLLCAMRFYRS